MLERCDGRRTTLRDVGCKGYGAPAAPARGSVGDSGFSKRGGHHGANGFDDQIGFVEMNPVLTFLGDDLARGVANVASCCCESGAELPGVNTVTGISRIGG
ncbi:MAG: hypothetical protein ACLQDA_12095, partial [Terracidiphilus sp.]